MRINENAQSEFIKCFDLGILPQHHNHQSLTQWLNRNSKTHVNAFSINCLYRKFKSIVIVVFRYKRLPAIIYIINVLNHNVLLFKFVVWKITLKSDPNLIERKKNMDTAYTYTRAENNKINQKLVVFTL